MTSAQCKFTYSRPWTSPQQLTIVGITRSRNNHNQCNSKGWLILTLSKTTSLHPPTPIKVEPRHPHGIRGSPCQKIDRKWSHKQAWPDQKYFLSRLSRKTLAAQSTTWSTSASHERMPSAAAMTRRRVEIQWHSTTIYNHQTICSMLVSQISVRNFFVVFASVQFV
jgi:hypothetical protein